MLTSIVLNNLIGLNNLIKKKNLDQHGMIMLTVVKMVKLLILEQLKYTKQSFYFKTFLYSGRG